MPLMLENYEMSKAETAARMPGLAVSRDMIATVFVGFVVAVLFTAIWGLFSTGSRETVVHDSNLSGAEVKEIVPVPGPTARPEGLPLSGLALDGPNPGPTAQPSPGPTAQPLPGPTFAPAR